ncbi:MAG: VWA domain-containing protein, partial [Phycisphaerales bacterium]|nr:VWA domain-containing protein [Phycisphaerales bacterium]
MGGQRNGHRTVAVRSRNFGRGLPGVGGIGIGAGALLWAAATAVGGTGTMRQVGVDEWVLDFCVSVRFDATEAQLTRVREAFQLGSPILNDATDGQVRFGRISIFNDSQGGQEAEVWIHPGTGGAFATYGQYGDYDHHITMYYGSNIASADIDSFPDRAAYTMAHEFAHHLWNIRDEYNGIGCVESDPDCVPDMQNCCDCEAWPHSPVASYCLMDNYFTRGGNLGAVPSGTGTYTLNEFCIAANHDPDTDTFQESTHGQSCWTYIANHPDRGLADPGIPAESPVATPAPQFFDEDIVQPRFVLCMDTSGSMGTQDLNDAATRLHRLKQAGHIFINLLNDGDELGIVEYSTTAAPVFPIQAILNANDRQDAKDIITDFDPNGSTAIGRGLRESRDMLTPLPDSCTQRIVLCSDGYGNTGPDELTYIPSLVNNRLPTSCLAIGGSVSEDNLKQIAYQTG